MNRSLRCGREGWRSQHSCAGLSRRRRSPSIMPVAGAVSASFRGPEETVRRCPCLRTPTRCQKTLGRASMVIFEVSLCTVSTTTQCRGFVLELTCPIADPSHTSGGILPPPGMATTFFDPKLGPEDQAHHFALAVSSYYPPFTLPDKIDADISYAPRVPLLEDPKYCLQQRN